MQKSYIRDSAHSYTLVLMDGYCLFKANMKYPMMQLVIMPDTRYLTFNYLRKVLYKLQLACWTVFINQHHFLALFIFSMELGTQC